MKNGTCSMCKSNEVYMTEDMNNLTAGSGSGLSFYAIVGQEKDSFYFDTYICLACGYTAIFAHSTKVKGNPSGLALLKKTKGWKKAG